MLLLRCQPDKLNGLTKPQLVSNGTGIAVETTGGWQRIATQRAGAWSINR